MNISHCSLIIELSKLFQPCSVATVRKHENPSIISSITTEKRQSPLQCNLGLVNVLEKGTVSTR